MSLLAKVRPPEITSPLRDPRVTVRVGAWLGVAVLVCFLTGLLSHLHQHPVGWLPIPPRPAWGYRVTQGLHVASGIACVPLVLVKLFSVFPRLLEWPPVRSLPHALERLSVAGLVGAMLFEVVTGLLNVAQLYPWGFFFPSAHYAVAWVLVGSVLLHLAVKAPVIAEAWRTRTTDAGTPDGTPDAVDGALTRRGLLVSTGAAVGAVTLVTIGQTVPGLSRFALLAPRRPTTGPQGFPVNKTARSAGVAAFATSPQWRLLVAGPAARAFSLDELAALPQQSVSLPIACVEGWSATVRWDGVRLADVLALTGLDPAAGVLVTSLEAKGLYGRSTLTADQALDPQTLLALRANGETLALDHGFPLRLIAPNRPGVQQTKWLSRIETAR
ncbi:molybdopterin-dependent oxidoreductase [Kineosporia sp. R_H_3]|uniref:molybdopterin-dependent oxidoreductase n=1 Tax=Kineosporia sp. R_H_3 TaxID=1961848 RepID=UPI000B4B56B9|nr:molybdopterin-dependent oxidoreductase [Kineosporia sp. R_H_3]